MFFEDIWVNCVVILMRNAKSELPTTYLSVWSLRVLPVHL